MKRIRLKCTASTNTIARELVDQGCEEPTLITAQRQESGKGQYNRSFSSPSGGLYFSLLFKPQLEARLIPMLTLATGVACAECITVRYGLQPALKWPNDIYIDDRKLGGILCESVIVPGSETWVIIGVGINVNSSVSVFPDELAGTVTTILDLTGSCSSLDQLLEEIIAAIFEKTALLGKNRTMLLDAWRRHDYLFGRIARYTDERINLTGRGCGLDQNGCYCIEDESGRRHSVLGGTLRPA